MDRRDVLKLGAVAGVSGSGCVSLLSNPASVGAGEMEGFLASLDAGLSAVSSTGTFFDAFLPKERSPELAARARHGEDLTRKTLRSLLLVGTLQELPPERMAHDGVQQRLRDSMGLFDDAMFGMSSVLEALSPTERADVSKALSDDPQLGMRILGSVDEEAARFGVSLKQRTRLRALSAHTCARLRQSPGLVITEYTGKMHKVAARHGARAAAERSAAAALGNALLWQGQAGDSSAVGGVLDAGVLTAPPPPPQVAPEGAPDEPAPAPPVTQPARKPNKPSTDALTAGGIALGVGAALVGLGFVLSPATGGGSLIIGITFGALLGLTAIVCLIVALAFLAAGK
jgi:hypothetical protein